MLFERVEQSGGQRSDVLVINDVWIFRFPRLRDEVARMIAETHLLKALRGRLPLPIPEPVYHSFDYPVPGLAFVGYRRLPGEPFTRDSLGKSGDRQKHVHLAGQLVEFLRALHGIPLESLNQSNGVGSGMVIQPQVQDRRETWEALYMAVRRELFTAMREDARQAVTEHFERYLDDSALQSFTPALRHGDFCGENILWDPQRGKITGVQDFTNCAVGDPALDLAAISTLGEDFSALILRAYAAEAQDQALLKARMRFYLGTFALQEALAGLHERDQAAYLRGMASFV